jgi:hypothetical protein
MKGMKRRYIGLGFTNTKSTTVFGGKQMDLYGILSSRASID